MCSCKDPVEALTCEEIAKRCKVPEQVLNLDLSYFLY